MIINEKEIDFRISRKKDVENFERALQGMKKKEEEIKAMGKERLGDVIGGLEEMFRDFFKTATGIDVVGDCDDTSEMMDMYHTFLKEIEKQKGTVDSLFSPLRIR